MGLRYFLQGQKSVFKDYFSDRKNRRLKFGRISYGRGFFTVGRIKKR